MNKRSAFLFVLLMFQWSVVTAQKNSITISGVVTDKINKQAIEFATVQLLNIPDSSVVTSTVTDKKGKFILTDIAAGKYILQCSFIGYTKSNQHVSVSGYAAGFV